MTFLRCNNVWGDVLVLDEPPSVSRHRNVIYRPFAKDIFFPNYPGWGITNENGELVRETAYVRGPDDMLVGQAPHQDPVAPARLNGAPETTYIYAGPLIPHYGHFLLTSVARLWFALDHEPTQSISILYHSDHSIEDMRRISYIDEILGATGIPPKCFTTFSEMTFIDELIVPEPLLIEQKSVNRRFLDVARHIGDGLMGGVKPLRNNRPLYMSKSRLDHGVARFTNEEDVDAALVRNGFSVVFPECLSLRDQVCLFESHDVICSSATSAYHTHILAQNKPRMLSVNNRDMVNSNFLLLDRLKEVEVDYMYEPRCSERGASGSFMTTYLLDDPGDYAEQIDTWARMPPKQIQDRALAAVPDLAGENYLTMLAYIHESLNVERYMEIGILDGSALALSSAASIAIDVRFDVNKDVIGSKPVLHLFQRTSDEFFSSEDAIALLGGAVDLALLSGKHQCEHLLSDFAKTEKVCRASGVIVLRDCIPVELAMTDRVPNRTPALLPHRAGWWTGDLWRTALVLKHHRADLRMISLDCEPTGLILFTNLDPSSTILQDHHDDLVAEMMAMDLAAITLEGLYRRLDLRSSRAIVAEQELAQMLRPAARE